jgi:uncharacterized protein YlxW (UPF0749 family)
VTDPAGALGLRPDPTYEYGTSRGDRRDPRGWTAVAALLVGFVLVAGLPASRGTARALEDRRADLIDLIAARQQRTAELGERLTALRAEVAAAERQAAAGVPALSQSLERAEAQAHVTPVAGPGVRVTLDDAEDCTSAAPEDCRIVDSDVQEAVNVLFALGAEAIAVDTERVVATTAVRNAGATVLVNYRVLTPPYEIVAVGPPVELAEGLAASGFGRDFAAWTESFGLGFDVEPVAEVVVPGYTGGLRLRNARAGTVEAGEGP